MCPFQFGGHSGHGFHFCLETLKGEKCADWLCWKWSIELVAPWSSLHPKKIIGVVDTGILMINQTWSCARESQCAFCMAPADLKWKRSRSQLREAGGRDSFLRVGNVRKRNGFQLSRRAGKIRDGSSDRSMQSPWRWATCEEQRALRAFRNSSSQGITFFLWPHLTSCAPTQRGTETGVSKMNEEEKGQAGKEWQGDHTPFHQQRASLGKGRSLTL